MEETQRPKVGVGVFVLKDGKVLAGRRRGAHGAGTWGLVGGHLEFGETAEDCARREVREEFGFEIDNIRIGPYTNNYFETEEKHYITLFVIANYASGELTVKELDFVTDVHWSVWEDFPRPAFPSVESLIAIGFDPFKI